MSRSPDSQSSLPAEEDTGSEAASAPANTLDRAHPLLKPASGGYRAFNGSNFGASWPGSSARPTVGGMFQADMPCTKGDETSANVLAKPRLTLKPSGLTALPASSGSVAPSAVESSSASVVAHDSSSSSSDPGLAGASAAAVDETAGASAKYLWSARLVCKPAAPEDGTSASASIGPADGSLENANLVDSAKATARSPGDAVGGGSSPKQPFGGSGVVREPQAASCGSAHGGFVFGQNLCERVTNAEAAATESKGNPLLPPQPSANGDFVFGHNLDERVENAAAAAATAKAADARDGGATEHQAADSGGCATKTTGKSLEEAVSEYERLRNSGPVLPEVEVVTGEEEESNVMQANCRLFCFDKERSNWVERGRGLLRLNDSRRGAELSSSGGAPAPFQSRIVMRTSGILRVILNTKVWSGMLCEKINQKSLRITGMEDSIVRVFLVSAAPKDVDGLFSAVLHRIDRLKRHEDLCAMSAATAEGSHGESASSRKRGASTASEELIADTDRRVADIHSTSLSPSKKPRPDDVLPADFASGQT